MVFRELKRAASTLSLPANFSPSKQNHADPGSESPSKSKSSEESICKRELEAEQRQLERTLKARLKDLEALEAEIEMREKLLQRVDGGFQEALAKGEYSTAARTGG